MDGPAVMYRPDKVLKAGGGDASTPSPTAAYTIDLSQPSPTWSQPGTVADMNEGRGYFHFVVLPDGKVLAVGGRNLQDPVLGVEMYDPGANTWTVMDSLASKRDNHAMVALLPDGRVVAQGDTTGVADPEDEDLVYYRPQIYSPPYLFAGPRPVISNVQAGVSYGALFDVDVSTAPGRTIENVVLIRLASMTHSNNFDQLYVPLTYQTLNPTTLRATAPPNGNSSPPGYYMLFVVDDTGVPSESKMVQLTHCNSNSACSDQNVCTFDQCQSGCTNTGALRADIANNSAGCGPDGQVNLFDILAVLDAFQGVFASGCEMHNADMAAQGNPCTTDELVNIFDIFAVLDAFQGEDPCNCGAGGTPDPPPTCGTPPEPEIELDVTRFEAGGEVFYEVEVYATDYGDMRGYELDLELTGPDADQIEVEKIYVDDKSPLYAFRGIDPDDIKTGIDERNMRLASVLSQGTASGRQYLATFTYVEKPGAPEEYAVTVQTEVLPTVMVDPVGCAATAPQASGLLATP